MRGLIISIILLVFCIVGAFAGLFGAQTGITFASCGALYFIMFALAWTGRGAFAGKRLALVDNRAARLSTSPSPIRARAAANGRAAVSEDATL
jgi:uncharacterized membrane protein YGL010W